MKLRIITALFALCSLVQSQEKRDLLEIESKDGKRTSVQLLSATFTQVQFKRLDSDKPFELPLSKLSEATVKAIRAWTVEYNKRTPLSFRQFSLGMGNRVSPQAEGGFEMFRDIKTVLQRDEERIIVVGDFIAGSPHTE